MHAFGGSRRGWDRGRGPSRADSSDRLSLAPAANLKRRPCIAHFWDGSYNINQRHVLGYPFVFIERRR